ncbi:MAG: uncharacterized protein KVP18_002650 [Porospora cf. gigantea A]|uniref:uncharacterized protein n=1 Tax=Porospora cf. gigantea A TaxID=2853593 RepID=UPI0035594B95|nr:MAG: hypothetical protein KVP18_002650 [Porospora cf. gigantea A]
MNIVADVDSAFIDPPLLESSPWRNLLEKTWLGQLPLAVTGPRLPDEPCTADSEEGVCHVFPHACVGIQWLDMHMDDDTGLGWFRNCLRPLIPTFEGPVCAFIRSALRVPIEDPLVSDILRSTLSFNPGSYSQRLFVVIRQSLSIDVPSAADNSLADLRILLRSLKQSAEFSELEEISVATEEVLSKCSTFKQNHHCDLLQNAVEGVLQIVSC